MFLAEHTMFSERARVYTSMTALAGDFPSTSSVYIAGQRFFGQELVPARVVVGRKQVNGVDGTISTLANNSTYSLTINGANIGTTSDGTATAVEIVAALKIAVDAAALGVTFTDNLDGTFDIDVTTPGTAWSVKASSNITLNNKASTETWPDAITAVETENSDWILMTAETHEASAVLSIAGAIEAREKVYGTSTSDAAVKTSAIDDLASQLKDLGYQKTFIMWKADSATAYPECALGAYQIQPTPGSNSWAYKSLTGTAVDRLTGTEALNLANKNVITYENIANANVTTGGKMCGGEYIDVMMGVLWLTARIRERIWSRLVNNPKIAYTAQGVAILEAEVRAQLQEGVRNNFIADAPAFSVFVPDVLAIDPNLRALRTLEGLSFSARLAGAIHFVSISGSVYV